MTIHMGMCGGPEQRNMEAFAQLIAHGKVNVPASYYPPFFRLLMQPERMTSSREKTGEAFLGVLVTYSGTPDLSPRITCNLTWLMTALVQKFLHPSWAR